MHHDGKKTTGSVTHGNQKGTKSDRDTLLRRMGYQEDLSDVGISNDSWFSHPERSSRRKTNMKTAVVEEGNLQ